MELKKNLIVRLATVAILSGVFLFTACGGGDSSSSNAPIGNITMNLDGDEISITGTQLPEIWGMAAQLTHTSYGGFGAGDTVIHRRYNAAVGFTMIFEGQAVGAYAAQKFSFQWDGVQYWNCELPLIDIQQYDDVDGRIAGSFSEITCDANPNTTPAGNTWTVTLTDGAFDVLRVADDIY